MNYKVMVTDPLVQVSGKEGKRHETCLSSAPLKRSPNLGFLIQKFGDCYAQRLKGTGVLFGCLFGCFFPLSSQCHVQQAAFDRTFAPAVGS